MELYKKYLEETHEGKSLVYDEDGFASYWIKGTECYIEDIYTVPDKRQTYHAADLANKIAKIAKDRGCTLLTGSVVPSANESTRSLKVLLGYGFKLLSSSNNFIIFGKDL